MASIQLMWIGDLDQDKRLQAGLSQQTVNDKHRPKKIELKTSQKVIRIGRVNSKAPPDYPVESTINNRMISRNHATIERLSKGGFMLYDHSLNGTYVNYTRVTGGVVLKHGDVVCFGHMNGANLKPGEQVPSFHSDLKYKVELMEKDKGSSGVATEKKATSSAGPPPKKSSAGARSSGDSSSEFSDQEEVEEEEEAPRAKTTTAAVSKKPLAQSKPIPTSSISLSQVGSSRKKKLPGKPEKRKKSSDVSSDEASDASGDAMDASSDDEHDITLPTTKSTPAPAASKPVATTPTSGLKKRPHTDTTGSGAAIGGDSSKKRQPPDSNGSLSGRKKEHHISSSSSASIKKKFIGKDPQQQRKRSPAAVPHELSSPVAKKVSAASSTTASATAVSSTTEVQFHYDTEECGAKPCRRPQDNAIDWIQCDKCSQWYHQVCVNFKQNQVDSNDNYYCPSCCKKKDRQAMD